MYNRRGWTSHYKLCARWVRVVQNTPPPAVPPRFFFFFFFTKRVWIERCPPSHVEREVINRVGVYVNKGKKLPMMNYNEKTNK